MNSDNRVLSTPSIFSRKHPRDETEYDCTSLEDDDSVYMDTEEEELLGRSIKKVRLSHISIHQSDGITKDESCDVEATYESALNDSGLEVENNVEDNNMVHNIAVVGVSQERLYSSGSLQQSHKHSEVEVLPRVGEDGDPIEPVDYATINQLLRQLAYMRIERSHRSSGVGVTLSASPQNSACDRRSFPGTGDPKFG